MKPLLFIMMLLTSSQMMAQNENFIRYNSPYPFEESIKKLKHQLKHHQITIFSEINHSNEAEKVGLTLAKTMVFIVGNPKVGTMLMQENQDIALHLPLKILVKENANKEVIITYKKLESLAEQYHLKKTLPIVQKIDNLMKGMIISVVEERVQYSQEQTKQ